MSDEPQEQSDTELLEACKRGSSDAWTALMHRYERLVFSIPLRLGLEREIASEVFQHTFVALYGNIDAVRDGAKIGGWLATVARRQSWKIIARGKLEMPFPDDESQGTIHADMLTLGCTDVDTLERRDVNIWLAQGLHRLRPRCRSLLQALYFDPDEPSYDDVARRTGVPVGSIGPTRARCLAQLRKLLHSS